MLVRRIKRPSVVIWIIFNLEGWSICFIILHYLLKFFLHPYTYCETYTFWTLCHFFQCASGWKLPAHYHTFSLSPFPLSRFPHAGPGNLIAQGSQSLPCYPECRSGVFAAMERFRCFTAQKDIILLFIYSVYHDVSEKQPLFVQSRWQIVQVLQRCETKRKRERAGRNPWYDRVDKTKPKGSDPRPLWIR